LKEDQSDPAFVRGAKTRLLSAVVWQRSLTSYPHGVMMER